MKTKKSRLALLLMSVLIASIGFVAPVETEAGLWLDRHSKLQAKQFKKIVVLPVFCLDEDYADMDTYKYFNDNLEKDTKKYFKKSNVIGFRRWLDEKKVIIRKNMQMESLKKRFNSEEERRKAIYDLTASDGYLVPQVTRDEVESFLSPETHVKVPMKSYVTVVEVGPDGKKYSTLDVKEWEVDHVIPQRERTLRMTDMTFILYDTYTGKKAMTYDTSNDFCDKNLEFNVMAGIRDLEKAWAQKKKHIKYKKETPTLGYGEISFPDMVNNDELKIKSVWYAIKDEAENTLEKIKPVDKSEPTDYLLTGEIHLTREKRWVEPSAKIQGDTLMKHEGDEWFDSNKRIHTIDKYYYCTTEENIKDTFGRYFICYNAKIKLNLVDTQTGQVVSEFMCPGGGLTYDAAVRDSLRGIYQQINWFMEKEERSRPVTK